MYKLELFSIDDNTFRAKSNRLDTGPLPMEKLQTLASCYSSVGDQLSIDSDSEELAERFLQLLQRQTNNEYNRIPKTVINYLTNLQTVDRYDFQANQNTGRSKSVVLLGAGPSLERDIDKAFDSGHFVVACGSAIAYLARKGLKPDACLALDPNDSQVERFKLTPDTWNDVPLIYKGRLAPEALALWPGKKIWVPGTGWKGASLWEGSVETFPGGGIGVSTWSLALCKYIGFESIYLVGFDLGKDINGNIYGESLQDLETEDTEQYKAFREASLHDEAVTLSEIIKDLELDVRILSRPLAEAVHQETIPKEQDSKWEVSYKTFTRTYWRRLRRGAGEMVDSISRLDNKKNTTFDELQGLAIAKYLLHPQLQAVVNKNKALGVVDLSVFLKSCQALKPLLKRIAICD